MRGRLLLPVIAVFVSLSLTQRKSASPCKNGRTDPDAVWGEHSWGPKRLCARRRSRTAIELDQTTKPETEMSSVASRRSRLSPLKHRCPAHCSRFSGRQLETPCSRRAFIGRNRITLSLSSRSDDHFQFQFLWRQSCPSWNQAADGPIVHPPVKPLVLLTRVL